MIRVLSNKQVVQFPIRIVIDKSIDQLFTIKAAIELRRKLETEISNYQVVEACEGMDEATNNDGLVILETEDGETVIL